MEYFILCRFDGHFGGGLSGVCVIVEASKDFFGLTFLFVEVDVGWSEGCDERESIGDSGYVR